MKFINYLEKITQVDVFAMTSFLIFFTFFLAVVWWSFKADKRMIDKINRLPLED